MSDPYLRASFRRHHQERKKKRVVDNFWGGAFKTDLDVLGRPYDWERNGHRPGGRQRQIGILARTPKTCSSLCCGNPRHHLDGDERLTIQERKSLDDWREEWKLSVDNL